jgi:hypothetical protein
VCHVSLPSSYRSRRGHIHLPRVLPLVGCWSKTPTVASCKVGTGNSVCFWIDSCDFDVLQWQFPHLFSFGKQKNVSVQKFGNENVYANLFTPLSDIVTDQWPILSNMIESLNPLVHAADCWSYIWVTCFHTKACLHSTRRHIGFSPNFEMVVEVLW